MEEKLILNVCLDTDTVFLRVRLYRWTDYSKGDQIVPESGGLLTTGYRQKSHNKSKNTIPFEPMMHI